MSGDKIQRILIISVASLRSTIAGTALARELKKRLPKTHIDWMTSPEGAELLWRHPGVDRVVAVPKLFADSIPSGLFRRTVFKDRRAEVLLTAWSLRPDRYSVAIDLDGEWWSACAAWLTGAPYRLGSACTTRTAALFLTHIAQPRDVYVHSSEVFLDILGLLQIRPHSFEPLLTLSTDDVDAAVALLERCGIAREQQFAVIGPGTDTPWKRWPADRFAEVADRLLVEYSLPSVLIGSACHKWLLERVRVRSGSLPANLAGRTTIRQAAAVLRLARIFIGVDTGLVSVAAAVRTPSVVVCSYGSRRQISDERVSIVAETPVDDAVSERRRPGIIGVSAQDVMSAVDGWLSSPISWRSK
ncbi:MAG: glycosyltransferase family 9 protein [Armatimonadota bacterium]